nr:MAG TPA: hypothetical protein [Caudoviricetes sp.]
MAQTTVQHPETIRFGSGRLEIGKSIDSLVDIGALTGVHFTHELGDKVTITSDNAGVILERAGTQTAKVEANLMEINLDTLAVYMGGVSKLETVAGSQKTVTNEEHTLKGTTFIRLDHRMGDGNAVTIDSVKKKGGSAAVEDTDYIVALDSDGYTCIARKSGSSVITDGSTVQVSYKYTPAAYKRLSFGGLQQLDATVARITNYDSLGREFSITVYKATADSGIEIEFQADDADETDVVPITLVGTEDTSRAVGDQLFVIEDHQM